MQRRSIIYAYATVSLLFLAACSKATVDVGKFTPDASGADMPVPMGGTPVSVTGGAGGPVGGVTGTGGAMGTGGATNSAPKETFTEKVGSLSFDMVYVPGGTFTLGCEAATCPPDTKPVSGVKVSSYHIGKTEVTTALYGAVMRTSSSASGSITNVTWYDGVALACELSKLTGRRYRLMTEAEFEYAAKNHLSSLEQIGTGEEWAYNSWSTTHVGGTDPVGPYPGEHVQKTRRDVQGTIDNITGRLIRSIDGLGPALRLAISAELDYPPDYVPSCEYKCPCSPPDPVNSYRDPQWVTGSDAQWTTGSIAIGKFDLRVWDDGTASLNNKDGQWFTSNNIAFVFVPSSGPLLKFPYIFLDASASQGAVISDAGLANGFSGRIEKKSASSLAKPIIAGLKGGAELAAAAGDDYKMIDMVNIPESAKKQDPRLIDTTSDCWFQNNQNAGGTHNYRKDIAADEFRLAVIDKGQVSMLANGKWFTVNNTFLRVMHATGYTTEYLYTMNSDGYLLHLSFQGYERAELRMLQKYDNAGGKFPDTCLNDSCSSELKKGEAASRSAQMEAGKSTFRPAPCPAGGCK